MEVIIITGTPGAGKSSVAEAVSLRLERSAHIQVDFFRKMIRAGYSSPHHWNDERNLGSGGKHHRILALLLRSK